MMPHVPEARNFTVAPVVPETVQTAGVVEVKLTVKPEVAEALSVSDVFIACAAVIAGKVMVCVCRTANVCETCGAAA
jgi:hypothetical protein